MSFLKYTGNSEINEDGSCTFKMEKQNNLVDEDGYIEVTSPVIDNSFQQIFGHNENITKDLLNSIMYPKKDRIKELTFLSTNYAGEINAKYSLGFIRVDVLCRCDLYEDKDDKDLELIVDLEMQIEFNKENTKRFINYLKTLYSNYETKKIIVLALVFRDVPNPYVNKGSKIYLKESRIDWDEEINIFDEFPIYQIDISYCYNLIFKKGKSLWIMSEDKVLENKGKEWIKFFNIPNWCGYYKDNYYAFPTLKKILFESKEIPLALKILSKVDKTQYEMHLYDWEERVKNFELFEKLNKENEEQKKEIENLKKILKNMKKKKK